MGDGTMLQSALTRVENAARRMAGAPPDMDVAEIRARYADLFCQLFTYYTVLFAAGTAPIPLVPLREVKFNPDYDEMLRASRNMIKTDRLLCAVRARVHGKLSPFELRREIAFMQDEIDEIKRRFPAPPVAQKAARPDAPEPDAPARKRKKMSEVPAAT